MIGRQANRDEFKIFSAQRIFYLKKNLKKFKKITNNYIYCKFTNNITFLSASTAIKNKSHIPDAIHLQSLSRSLCPITVEISASQIARRIDVP